MDRTQALEEQVRRLTDRVARMEGGEPGQENGKQPRSRRGFLKFGAGAVMGALGMAAAKVMPAAAITGNPTLLGTANFADAPTTITTTSTTNARVIGAVASNFSQAALDSRAAFRAPLQGLGGLFAHGVDGWAQGAGSFGVYGVSDEGFGVVGESWYGIAVYARRSGRIRQDSQTVPGAPTYSVSGYEQIRDLNGALWLSGPTGQWRRVNSLRFDTADGTGGVFAPFRLVDTRSSPTPFAGPFAGNAVITIPVSTSPNATGASAIPADAVGVVGNLTAVLYTGGGYLTIYPAGAAIPGTSSVNFLSGQNAIANAFAVGLGTGGAISVVVATPAPNTSHFIVDITGYIQ